MHPNGKILEKLIDDDFGIETKDRSRWGKSDDHSSLVLDKERGLFFWNSREIVGDPLVYLTKVRGMRFDDAKNYLRQFKDFKETYVYTLNTKEENDVVVYPRLAEVFYESSKSVERRDYWYRRGISDLTIDKFQLGWYNDFNTIPVNMDGVFRNFQMRKDRPDKRIKMYYKGVGPLLFNSDVLRVTSTVYITEGLTDCLRLAQEGIPTVSHTTGAGGWQLEWFKYFIEQKQIYVIFDNDKAGIEGSKKVARSLGLYRTKIFTFDGYEDQYDIVNFFRDGGTKDELLSLIEGKSKYLFEIA